jgi:thiamine biosynthesis protein ThiI
MPDSHPHQAAILIKVGELYLKGENRPAFVQILLDSVRLMLGDAFGHARLEGRAGKFLLSGCGHDPAVLDRLERVFGISLIDEVFLCPPSVEAVRSVALDIMEPFIGAASFKIESKRTWKKFPLISTELSRVVGEDVVTRLGIKVDLHNPKVTLKIQIDPDQAFLSVNSRVGAGGLPVGSSGRGLLLLSGGIDSPVAGWYAMRRGLRLRALHFHSPPYTGSAVTRKIEDLAGVLRLYDPGFGVLLARFTETQEIIRDRVREDYRMVMLRWAMVRIASRVAGSLGLSALVSGENLGQVASQTIDNMACIEKASTLPLVRPLIAFDKADTVRRAREIGSYAVSIRRAEDCCSLFVPRHPVTRADPGTCLGFDAMLEESGAYDRCMETITDL